MKPALYLIAPHCQRDRVGQDSDPFAPIYGLSFARVSLQGALAGLDLSAFTSSSFKMTTTTNILAQSFLLTSFGLASRSAPPSQLRA
jgi:hypothetical protein